MDYDDMQPALDGLAPKRRKTAKPKTRVVADSLPIARVALDVQAAHLGRTFDYLVEERFSQEAVPGVRVRVRFGGKLLDGFVWERTQTSDTDPSLLKYIERVVSPLVLINAEMRRDIDRVAAIFGGTRANIIRVAVPPRVARIEKERGWSKLVSAFTASSASSASSEGTTTVGASPEQSERYRAFETRRVQEEYAGADAALAALSGTSWSQMVWDCLPGREKWAADMAWAVVTALASGKSTVVCLPHHRAVREFSAALVKYGLRPPQGQSEYGDFVVVDSSQPQEERYRSFVALCSGAVKCAIGTRGVMYAPVRGQALFAVLDDNAYQNTDGFMPYANVRDVLLERARLHHGVFLTLGYGRAPASQFEADGAPATVAVPTATTVPAAPAVPTASRSKVLEVHGYPNVLQQARPWIRWLNPQELQALGDATAGSRVPHTVSAALTKAASRGPVLIAVPYDGYTEVLSCSQCRRQARCRRCSGPLRTRGRELPVCAWCAQPAAGWVCSYCGSEHFRAVRIGAQGTAAEIRGLFRNLPLVVSTPSQARGVVESVPATPRVVIATPGAQPRVEGGDYQAVAILDAWTSLYSQALDSRVDTLNVWMQLASLAVSAEQGGQVLLVGQCDPDVAQSLVTWDPRLLARKEVTERAEAGLPPAVCAASIWGKYAAVMSVLDEIGALSGDFAEITVRGEDGSTDEVPSVMGPIEIPPAPTMRNRQLDGSNDRVRAIVRVPLQQREELAQRLHVVAANRAIRREPGELRFWINPKDLRER